MDVGASGESDGGGRCPFSSSDGADDVGLVVVISAGVYDDVGDAERVVGVTCAASSVKDEISTAGELEGHGGEHEIEAVRGGVPVFGPEAHFLPYGEDEARAVDALAELLAAPHVGGAVVALALGDPDYGVPFSRRADEW